VTDQFAATDDAVSAGGVRHNHAPAHEAPPHVVPLDVVPLDVTDNDDVPAGVTNIDDVPAGVTDNDDVLAGVTDNDDGLDDVTDVDDGLDEDVSYGWHRWAAISLLRGTPAANVITTMTDEGVLESDAAATVARLFTDPVFEAGKWAMQQLRKLEGEK